jgi:hypothetical protein
LWTSGGPDGGAYLAGELVAGLWTTGSTFYTSCVVLALALALLGALKPPQPAPMLAP